jgi:agmatinase
MTDPTFAFQTSTTHAGFLKAPSLHDEPNAEFVVAGIPWDGATTNRPGARFGPYEIRRASHMLCDGTHPLFEVSPLGRLADAGDLAFPNTSLLAMRSALESRAATLAARHHVAWLGGDHSVTLSLLRVYRAKADAPLAIVHFDAHCDTWPDHAGEPSGHGTWVYEAIQEGLIDPTRTVQIGIRSAATREIGNYVAGKGGLIFTARALRGLEGSAQLAGVTRSIRERLTSARRVPVYLSLDIDCLDPAYAPGTGTPEPGGLTSAQVLTFLEDLADLDWIGMDLCEVAPAFDHAQLTSNAAANFVWTYLCGRTRAGAVAPRR